jgi:DNA-binding CsgD family transcriptional regulator
VFIRQLLYFFHILCLCAGSMVLLLSFMAFARRKDYWFRFYLTFVIAFFLLMAFQTFKIFYDMAAVPQAWIMSRVFTSLFLLVLNFMVYLLPFFATWLVRIPWKGVLPTLFTGLSAAYFALVLLYTFFFPGDGLVYVCLVFIFASMVVFSMILLFTRRERIASPQMKKLCMSFVILSTAFLPLIVIDAALFYFISGYSSAFVSGILAFPLYFLWFSVIALVYLVGYFRQLPESESEALSPSRLAEYKITEREKEIILLLQLGLTYKEIGTKLCISIHTVNNHVANIYAKAGVKNRIDLLRCLS